MAGRQIVMKRITTLFIFLYLFCGISIAQNKEIPFTQEDKDKLQRIEIKLERLDVKVEEGFKRLDERFESMEKRFDSMEKLFLSLFLWGFGVLFGAIGLIFGYLLYERRTIITSLEKNDKLLEERVEKLEKALKKVA